MCYVPCGSNILASEMFLNYCIYINNLFDQFETTLRPLVRVHRNVFFEQDV